MTSRIDPVAVRRGQTVEIDVSGTMNWTGAWGLLCEPPGLRGEVLKIEKTQPAPTKASAGGRRRGGAAPVARAKLEVDAGCPLGPREIRVATPQGVSSVGLIVVVDDPVIAEVDDVANDAPASAQKLTFPTVVSGRIGKLEDVDWYTFEARKGQRVTFEVWGNRLENKIHDLQTHLDPILSLHDQTGRELAAADNTRYADPLLSFQVPATGTYFLQVRDTTYTGNPAWSYALHAVTGSVAMAVHPLAVNPGTTAQLETIGPGEDRPRSIDLPIPNDAKPGVHEFSLSAGGGSLPLPLLVTYLPVSTETGEMPAGGDPARTAKLPVALCGRLGKQGDADGYRFEARQGTLYSFEVVARRAGSECDPVVRVLDAKGSIMTEADDTRGLGKDSRIEWKAPADGGYVLQVSDLHDRGGMAFGYVLLAEVAHPDFTLTCDPDLINVGPGGRVPVFVRLTRRNGFEGTVGLDWRGLPQGVTASPLTISRAMSEGVIVVSAPAETRHSAALVNLEGTATTSAGPIVRRANPVEEIYLPGGGRGHFPVETLALAVTDPSDVAVEASPREVVLAPGETTTLEVTVTRHPPYAQGVNLAIVLQHLGGVHGNPLPPGITVKEAGSKTLLGPKETKGKIILQAALTAPACDRVPIAVMGHVSINFVVKTAYSSAPILVSVRPRGKQSGGSK
jgi:Bacterial pre-peptidase C-terminal domain